MNKTIKIILLLSVFVLGFAIGLIIFTPQFREKTRIQYEATYEEVSLNEMFAEAELIFIGKVVSISPVKWNQDNSEYWYAEGKLTLPFHEVEVVIDQLLIDSIGVDKNVVITVLGASPSGSIDETIEVVEDIAHTLQVGDEAVFFVVNRELAWQNGTHPIIRFMGNPLTGYLKKGDDGLYHLEGEKDNEGISLIELLEKIMER